MLADDLGEHRAKIGVAGPVTLIGDVLEQIGWKGGVQRGHAAPAQAFDVGMLVLRLPPFAFQVRRLLRLHRRPPLQL